MQMERSIPQFPARADQTQLSHVPAPSADVLFTVERQAVCQEGSQGLPWEQGVRSSAGAPARRPPRQPWEGSCCGRAAGPAGIWGCSLTPSQLNFPYGDATPSAHTGCGAPSTCQQRPSCAARAPQGGWGEERTASPPPPPEVLGGACRGTEERSFLPWVGATLQMGPSCPNRASPFSCFLRRHFYIIFNHNP